MLRSTEELESYTIGATDGDIGNVKDFFFDDDAWVIRYVAVDTGAWLHSRHVLIPVLSIQRPDWASRRLVVSVDKDRIKHSPDIDTEGATSRQHEMHYLNYYGHPYYWNISGTASSGARIDSDLILDGDKERLNAQWSDHQDNDPHLRSCQALIGFHIKATDGEVGHVESLLVNEETWAVQYLVVNTSNWWIGHRVLIAPEWIDVVSWQHASVTLDLDCAAVRTSPHYESTEQLNRELEVALHDHYGRVGYWQVEAVMTRLE